MKKICRHILDAVVGVMEARAHSATKYVNERLTVRATQRLYGGKIESGAHKEIVLTIGRPNYLEREFIRVSKRAGERFPVKKLQLKFPPKRVKKR